MGRRIGGVHLAGPALAALAAGGLGGCGLFLPGETTGSVASTAKVVATPTAADRECLTRAMYFESNRSDPDGLLAVGTVVMNRLDAPRYPASICDVVGQKRQFAPGVLTRPVREADRPRIERVADAVLAGERHAGVGPALHFHTAGLSFPYRNMHYVAVAGGNTFYEKTDREGYLPAVNPRAVVQLATGRFVPVQVARVEPTLPPTTGRMPAIAATQLAYGAPVLPAGVPTRYASAP